MPEQHSESSSPDSSVPPKRPVAREAMDFWYDKQHKDLLFYLSIGIVFLELIVGGVAFFYGVIHATPARDGLPPQFQFPWLVYSIAAVVAPAVLLLIVHLAGVGLFRSLRDTREENEAWRQDLPERLRKVYAIVHGAPTVLLLVGIMALGAALFYIDGAMTALFRLGTTVEVYLPWIIGAVAGGWCLAYVARVWLNYRTKRLEAEYAFRREVLQRTGVIIVDRGSVQLPPSFLEDGLPRALEGGSGLALGQGAPQAPAAETSPHGPIVDVGEPGSPKARD
ncbi:MAG: hypothetical protein RRY29_10520 [Desulfovibrionaceae bacterium]